LNKQLEEELKRRLEINKDDVKQLDEKKRTSEEKKQLLNNEILELNNKLIQEQTALLNASNYEKQLSNEIKEVKRINALTEFERYIEDWKKRQEQRKIEFEEQKMKLVAEAEEIKKQQADLMIVYQTSKDTIKRLYQEAHDVYVANMVDEIIKTSKFKDAMISYYGQISDAIRNMMTLQTQAGV
jgi:hypothetical protein